MSRRYILRDRDILTPEAVNAILAKESLIKASKPADQLEGNLISAIGTTYHYYVWVSRASDTANQRPDDDDSALLTMLASEAVLRREWDNPEEDEAWADLLKAK